MSRRSAGLPDLPEPDLTEHRLPPRHEFTVPAVHEPVRVRIDTWGVPHIDAADAHDAFLAQGFVAARDRLFQLDLWRRRGLGLLAEALGARYVARDRAARLVRYRGDLAAEWHAYGPGAQAAAEAFVAGVNAWIELTRTDPRLLAPEFGRLGFLPGRWRAEDLAVVRSHGRFGNVEQELARAMTLRDLGQRAEDLRRSREPAGPSVIPEGLDLTALGAQTLAVYREATGPVDLLGPGAAEPVSPAPATDAIRAEGDDGSNAWVLGPSRTATGRPILASDPHRAMTLPSLRYISHLRCPQFDVIGAGEPVLPGMSMGHNDHLAFALTIFPIDQEDLYVYELDPADPHRYRHDGEWHQMERVVESVPVAGSEDAEVELLFTRHGPVLAVDARRCRAVALRAAWLEPGMAPYLGNLQVMTARDAQSYVAALSHWGAPGANHVYACTDGTIGWQAAGRAPVRLGWDGTLPVPGDGRFEWHGFRSHREMPGLSDPPDAWFATSNEFNIGSRPEWLSLGLSRDWAPEGRHRRLAELLPRSESWTVRQCVELQRDVVSRYARQAVGLLRTLATEAAAADPATQAAWRGLCAWDGGMRAADHEPLLYDTWFRHHLRPVLIQRALAGELPERLVAEAVSRLCRVHEAMPDPRPTLRLLAEAVRTPAGRSAVLGSLGGAAEALAAMRDATGAAPRWGETRVSAPRHPLATAGDDWGSPEPRPLSGNAETVALAGFDEHGVQAIGASFSMVVDVGDWDASLAINSPGQSGDPRSDHYDDLHGLWHRGERFPLLYSEEAIARHTQRTLVLTPH